MEKNKGVLLDVGCGAKKQEGFVGMDNRPLPGVDIVHDVEEVPWPLETSSVSRIVMVHLMEHIKPWLTISIVDEAHRVLEEGGLLFLQMPYGTSFGFYQDPTHCNPWNEVTPTYFDPEINSLYAVYEPKPWKIESCYYSPEGNLEVLMRTRPEGAPKGAEVEENDAVDVRETHDIVVRAARAPFLADRIEQLEAQLKAATDDRDRCRQELDRMNDKIVVRSGRAVKNIFKRDKSDSGQ